MLRGISILLIVVMGVTSYLSLSNNIYHYHNHIIKEETVSNNNYLNKQSIRVMTYNIQYGKGLDGIQDLNRIAEIIKESNADIIGLQEVERLSSRSNFINQTKFLAEKLNMYAVFSPALKIGTFQYGNAVLSRFPIIDAQKVSIKSQQEPRNILMTKIDLFGQEIVFISTHLGLSQAERLEHVNKIITSLTPHNLPTILVGDWNSRPNSKEVQKIKAILNDNHQLAGSNKGYTFPSKQAEARIDYIFTSSDIKVFNNQTIKTYVSDHLPVISDIKITLDSKNI